MFLMFKDYRCCHVAVAPTGYLSMKHLQPFPARILCQPGERGGMAGSVGGEASRGQNGKKLCLWDRVVVRGQVHWKLRNWTTNNKTREKKKAYLLKQTFSQRTADHVLEPRNNATLSLTKKMWVAAVKNLDDEADPSRICRDQIEVSLRSASSQYGLQIHGFGELLEPIPACHKMMYYFNFKRNQKDTLSYHVIPTSDILVLSWWFYILNYEKYWKFM